MPDKKEKNHKDNELNHDSKLTRKSSLRKPKENNNKERFKVFTGRFSFEATSNEFKSCPAFI